MENKPTRRQFLRYTGATGTGMALGGCFAGGTSALRNANEFIEEFNKVHRKMLSHADLAAAARHYKSVCEAVGYPYGPEQSALLEIMKHGLNGEGAVYIAVNGYKSRDGKDKNESWEYKTKVKLEDIAKGLTATDAEAKALPFSRTEAVNLIAGVKPSYEGLPTSGSALHVKDMPKRGYVMLHDTKRIETMLGSGEFAPLAEGIAPYTQDKHNRMLKTNTVDGRYNRDYPGAVQLVMTKLPGFTARLQPDKK